MTIKQLASDLIGNSWNFEYDAGNGDIKIPIDAGAQLRISCYSETLVRVKNEALDRTEPILIEYKDWERLFVKCEEAEETMEGLEELWYVSKVTEALSRANWVKGDGFWMSPRNITRIDFLDGGQMSISMEGDILITLPIKKFIDSGFVFNRYLSLEV